MKFLNKMDIYYIGGIILLGIVAGVLSGLFGIGGGLVIVPVLVMAYGFSQQSAQGTALGLLSIPVSLIAAINYSKKGMLDWQAVFLLAIGFIIGGFIGSKIALSFDARLMKKLFAILMIVMAVKLLLEKK